jgi:hypothetical protein
MKKARLRWAAKKPGQPVDELTFDIEYKDDDERSEKELKLAQQLVQGYVEVVWIGGDVKILVNEEAMYNLNMKDNCGFLGNIVFFRGDREWFGSLTNEDLRKVHKWCELHKDDKYSGNTGVQVFTGKAIEEYREKLKVVQKSQQLEWESL